MTAESDKAEHALPFKLRLVSNTLSVSTLYEKYLVILGWRFGIYCSINRKIYYKYISYEYINFNYIYMNIMISLILSENMFKI